MMKSAVVVISSVLIAMSATASEENKSTYRAYDTPVNYNFGEIVVGKTSSDKHDADSTTIRGGGEGMLTENWIVDFYYTGDILDDYRTGHTSTVSLGANYRLPVSNKMDLVLGGGAIYGWYDYDQYHVYVSDGMYSPVITYSFTDTESGSDVGLLAKSSLRYGFTEKLEANVGASLVDLYDVRFVTLSSSITYYLTEQFGFGITGARKSTEYYDDTSIGAHIRFNFN